MGRLVIDGGDVYELDEECLREKIKEGEMEYINGTYRIRRETEKETEDNPPMQSSDLRPFSGNKGSNNRIK